MSIFFRTFDASWVIGRKAVKKMMVYMSVDFLNSVKPKSRNPLLDPGMKKHNGVDHLHPDVDIVMMTGVIDLNIQFVGQGAPKLKSMLGEMNVLHLGVKVVELKGRTQLEFGVTIHKGKNCLNPDMDVVKWMGVINLYILSMGQDMLKVVSVLNSHASMMNQMGMIFLNFDMLGMDFLLSLGLG